MKDERGFEIVHGAGDLEGFTFHIAPCPAMMEGWKQSIFTPKRCLNCICGHKDNGTDEIESCPIYGHLMPKTT
jgi:hypothetical protein